jgi:hypothetical protein
LEPLETAPERVIVERFQPPAPAVTDTSSLRLGLWIGAGSLAVASAVTTVLGSRAAEDLKAKRSELGVSRDELDSASRRAHTLLITADVCGASALLAGGGALYLTLADDPEEPEAEPTSQPRNTRLRFGLGWVAISGSY